MTRTYVISTPLGSTAAATPSGIRPFRLAVARGSRRRACVRRGVPCHLSLMVCIANEVAQMACPSKSRRIGYPNGHSVQRHSRLTPSLESISRLVRVPVLSIVSIALHAPS